MGTQVLSGRQVSPSSGGGTVTDLQLTATVPGQTQFNIFTMPTGLHNLIINGGLFWNGIDYHIITVGSNVKVEWISTAFQLAPSDHIIFRKY